MISEERLQIILAGIKKKQDLTDLEKLKRRTKIEIQQRKKVLEVVEEQIERLEG